MRTALKIKGVKQIKTGGGAKILVNGKETRVDDITAVRYSLGIEDLFIINEDNSFSVNTNNLKVIGNNRKDLDKSLHVVEIPVCNCDMHELVNTIREICGGVAVFVYVDYDMQFTEERFITRLELMRNIITGEEVDRVIFKESDELGATPYDIKELLKYVKDFYGLKSDSIFGLCNSPVGCSIGKSCLSAILCRQLSAKYGESLDMVVPSKNHEGMSSNTYNVCNCIGFIEVDSITECKSTSGKSEKKEHSGENKAVSNKKLTVPKKGVIHAW